MRTTFKSTLLRQLFDLPPKLVKNRLYLLPSILEKADLLAADFEGKLPLRYEDAIVTLKSMANDVEAPLQTPPGERSPWHLTRSNKEILLRYNDEPLVAVPEIGLLDIDQSVRLQCFETLLKDALPAHPSEGRWREILTERPLTAYELHSYIRESAEIAHNRWEAFLTRGDLSRITIRDVVPDSKIYYESLIGSYSPGLGAKEYVETVLTPHLRNTFERSPQWGWLCLEACYVGFSVAPEKVLEPFSDAQLLEVYRTAPSNGSPLALLPAVRVAIERIANPAFQPAAKEAIEAIVTAATRGGSDHQLERGLFSSVYLATQRLINVAETTWSAPPYWRRLAAWAHAHVLCDHLGDQIDVPNFQKWIEALQPAKGEVADYMDMRQEPLYFPLQEYLNAPWVIAASQLHRILETDEGKRLSERDPDLITSRMKGVADPNLWGQLPGPIDGGLRFNEGVDTKDEGDWDIQATFGKNLEVRQWHGLALLARIRAYPSDAISQLITYLADSDFPQTEVEDSLGQLVLAARIAACQTSPRLADAVALKIQELAPFCETPTSVSAAWSVLMTAAASHPDQEQWFSWLEDQLTSFSYRAKQGEPCGLIVLLCSHMDSLSPIGQWSWHRPRYTAQAAL